MDMAQLSNTLLQIFYIMIGLYMGLTMVFTIKDKNHKTRIGTALFWGILSAVFMFGDYIPSQIVGALVIVIAVLSATKQINIGTLKQLDETFATLKAEKLGLKIFIPSLSIAIIAMLIASFTDFSGTVAIGISSTLTLVLTFVITKAKPKEFLEDSNRMYQSMGSFVILPQLLASLGVLFTAAGVGDKISAIISGVIPTGNVLVGVIAYCVGMAVFTAIMGNAFAAFSVITVGVGLPFVFAQGGDPVVCSVLALTAGYCGTLLTPMAANFNILPAALLELKDKNAVIKAQAPIAIILLVTHIQEDGQAAYFSNLPVKAMVKHMNDNNIPATLSNTAGTFVCNHVMYGILYMIDKKYPNIKGGFIHIPYMTSQVMDKKNTPFMSLDEIVIGLELALEACTLYNEDIKTIGGEIC